MRRVMERLIEITRIRDEQGLIERGSSLAQEREKYINMFVRSLREEEPNIRVGIVKSKIAWRSPVLVSLNGKFNTLGETAQRIAWELFPDQFSIETRKYVLGIENDPFYDNGEYLFLDDTEILAIESQKASAEKRYRTLLRNMRACYVSTNLQESLEVKQSQQ
jgi:hypothetical protein